MICNKLKECAEGQFAGKQISSCVNSSVRCIESTDKRTNVKCEERKKKYVLENTMKNHIILYRMDGGIILSDKSVSAGTCKCDYLFLINGAERTAVLVELKGVNVAHSLKQIQGTLLLFKDFFSTFSHVYGRAVVTSSTPNIKASPNCVNLMNTLRKTFGGNLKIVEKQFQEKDVDLSNK